MASFFGTYVDDVRGGGSTEVDCRQSIRRIATVINYLGQQDAPRKRGHAPQSPRAWAGSMCKSVANEGLYVFGMKEKWTKAKTIINQLLAQVSSTDSKGLDYSQLESHVGFLCHVSLTYPAIFPYLKGFYNTLNNWRCDRNQDGWKISKTAWIELLSGDIGFEKDEDFLKCFEERKRIFRRKREKGAPKIVDPVPRLKKDLMALKPLLSSEEPTLRLV